MTFKKYVKKYKDFYSVDGEFARDVSSDRFFPRYSKRKFKSLSDYHSVIIQYLYREGADRECLTAFERLWREYADSNE